MGQQRACPVSAARFKLLIWSEPVLAAVLLLASTFGTVAAESVRRITKVEKQAQIGSQAAAIGTPIHMNDQLRTGLAHACR